jgi:hypothetical protein
MTESKKKYIRYLYNRLDFSKKNLINWKNNKRKFKKENKMNCFIEMCDVNIKHFNDRIESLNLEIEDFKKRLRGEK